MLVILYKKFFFFLDPDRTSSIVASPMVTCPPIFSATETQLLLRREERAFQVDTLDVRLFYCSLYPHPRNFLKHDPQ